MMKPKKVLYKLNTDLSIQVWSIYQDDKSYWTVTSKLNGKKIVGVPTLVEAKSNRTLVEQIELEVAAKIKKKMDKKYVEDIKDIHKAEGNLAGYSAMLAHKFKDHKHKINFPCTFAT